MRFQNPVDTGRKTGVPKHDTKETVQRSVFTVDTIESVEINTEVLRAKRKKLQDEISEIDSLLSQISD